VSDSWAAQGLCSWSDGSFLCGNVCTFVPIVPKHNQNTVLGVWGPQAFPVDELGRKGLTLPAVLPIF
jgi:hypothetical protein